MKVLHLSVCSAVFAVAAGSAQVFAQQDPASQEPDPDWPCEQILVPEVSAAVVWDGPAVDKLTENWRDLPELAALVQRLTDRNAFPQQSDAQIAGFAAAQPPAEKDQRLTLLFAGVLETLNEDRSHLISGIKRYSRDQERRAQALDRHLTEMVELERDSTEAATQRLSEMRRSIEIEQRAFDDREKSIMYLCTRPVVVEQRLGVLARTIAGYLD
jgi:hypothetical protein